MNHKEKSPRRGEEDFIMGLIDDIKKWAHPYEDEDEDFEEFEEPSRRDIFEDRRSKFDDRRSKVVNIHATTQLNLESTNKDIARRLIDFLSGVAYAGEGKIKKVAANTYIITPYHVDIEGDLIDELENNGLYL